jgi:hypothetical protein
MQDQKDTQIMITERTVGVPHTILNQALSEMASFNHLQDSDPQVRQQVYPVWASKVVQAVDFALQGHAPEPVVRVTRELFNLAVDRLCMISLKDQPAGLSADDLNWYSVIVSAYESTLSELEQASPQAAFRDDIERTAARVNVDLSALMSFETFAGGREFHHMRHLPEAFGSAAEAIKVTDYCVAYPGGQLLGYNPDTGEAWFEDYKEEFRGPIELIERKLYLWAITECPELLEHSQAPDVA